MDLVIPDKTHDESRQGEALILEPVAGKNNGRKLYIESYGCAMNFSDSEIVASILSEQGFETTSDFTNADVIFINTCSIRENAETRVRNRLKEFKVAKGKNPGMVVGVLGCMAERLKAKFLEEEKLVDVVVGPDLSDEQECQGVGQIRRPEHGKPMQQVPVVRRGPDLQDEQGNGDGENGIAECDQPPGRPVH